MVYATCSVEPEENEAHFGELPEHLERVELGESLPDGVPWTATGAGGIRILPHEWGDGFSMHALRRLE
jgi:16S rRNA C967 or C1407 C5-methylase (RsmB/RsmF family)